MKPILINLVVEDELSAAVLRKVLDRSRKRYLVNGIYGRTGFGYIRSKLRAFNQAAKGGAWLVLTDLDQAECPPVLVRAWFGATPRHPNLLFMVAVREVEAWLLAHRSAFARFARIQESRIPADVESISDPKRFLIQLVSQSPTRTLREDVVPAHGSTSRQGPNYNAALAGFVANHWDPLEARRHSDSLTRLLKRLDGFAPTSQAGRANAP